MSLRRTLPWTRSPLVINAPMGGIAGADLAIAVSNAGGLGQIGGVENLQDLESQLAKVEQKLGRRDGLLPIGLGLLSFVLKSDHVVPLLQRFKPAVVWLFAAHDFEDYAVWAKKARQASPTSQVWVQVGSVEGALKIAEQAGPDALCMQGQDAGGHGFEKGAGIISLLPEADDALRAAGHSIPLVAAGGIVDGRGAAAALTLGAQGVVLGTRFLSAPQTNVHPRYRDAVLAASDGGQTTVRAKLFDELKGPNQWPESYDGRSLRTESFADHEKGVAIDDIRDRYQKAVKSADAGYGVDGEGRAATWAGTGVGLVKEEQSAAEIVEDVRYGIVAALESVKARL
ncbi:hypothetical protein DOTSEDRAFT_48153 [Dothistroma septosporum NZE10]|uniref:Nitronate monooxygenase domain-containing protein n=1 Tax=Dothistroma septosporum (strain NZE10 / CBS 128990) TaxID=675120 RepID=M2XJU6_DOTSN|nr:hypothetical protein DOTSEDRAFT_48153 [Dothistroma septosporum NZE10]